MQALRYTLAVVLVATGLLLPAPIPMGWEIEAKSGPESGLPVPVLVVPGWADYAGGVEPLRERLLESGWPANRVAALSFSDPVGGNIVHAGEIAEAVAALLELSGEGRVDIVAHSMGGLALRHYLAFGDGSDRVRRVVFLGTPHRGTVAAILSWGDGGREMVPGSEFLTALNAQGPLPEGIEGLAIRTPIDSRVIPGSSAMLPGIRNIEVCCPTHNELLDSERVFSEIRTFLREAPVPLPAGGDTRSGG